MSLISRTSFDSTRAAVAVALGLIACGGQKPASDVTTTAPEPAVTTAPATPPPAPSATAPEAPSSPPPEAPAPSVSAPEPVVPLADRLVAASVAFMIRYDDSAPKQAADAACAKTSEDPEAHVKCMEKERGKFVSDVLLFRKAGSALSLTVYKRQGNALQELSKSAIELTEQTPNRVKIKVTSDKGTRPLFAGRKELAVTTPEDSSSNIELDDPRFGKLVYEARIGLVDEPR
jgi:hypothetical protein